MLTERQRKALVFIERYQADKGGVSPTIKDIAAAMRHRSRSTAYHMLIGLEQRGFIRRLPYRQRAIEVLRPVMVTEILRFDNETKLLVPYSRSTPKTTARN